MVQQYFSNSNDMENSIPYTGLNFLLNSHLGRQTALKSGSLLMLCPNELLVYQPTYLFLWQLASTV